MTVLIRSQWNENAKASRAVRAPGEEAGGVGSFHLDVDLEGLSGSADVYAANLDQFVDLADDPQHAELWIKPRLGDPSLGSTGSAGGGVILRGGYDGAQDFVDGYGVFFAAIPGAGIRVLAVVRVNAGADTNISLSIIPSSEAELVETVGLRAWVADIDPSSVQIYVEANIAGGGWFEVANLVDDSVDAHVGIVGAWGIVGLTVDGTTGESGDGVGLDGFIGTNDEPPAAPPLTETQGLEQYGGTW